MQLVYGMLSRQLADTPDEVGQRGIRAIARRVTTLAQVYDHLLGNEITRTTDFGTYAVSLCRSLVEIRGGADSAVTLTCDSTQVMLDLDSVTALGIILAELVTNSYDHAFPDGTGSISVTVQAPAGNDAMATMTVLDSGPGFDAKAENKRHGLGLVRRLAEQVRGTVTLDSHHCTFWTIRFPVAT
jgi:two-component sensor histidine kinase